MPGETKLNKEYRELEGFDATDTIIGSLESDSSGSHLVRYRSTRLKLGS